MSKNPARTASYSDFVWHWFDHKPNEDKPCLEKENIEEKKTNLFFYGNYNARSITTISLYISNLKTAEHNALLEYGENAFTVTPSVHETDFKKLQFDPIGKATPECWDALVNKIFDALLVFGRPLRQYNCTFLLPLDLKLDSEVKTDIPTKKQQKNKEAIPFPISTKNTTKVIINTPKSGKQNLPNTDQQCGNCANLLQSYEYFLPHIRNYLFDTGDASDSENNQPANIKPIEHYRLNRDKFDLKNFNLKNFNLNDKKEWVTIDVSVGVKDISLYRYYNDIMVLAIQVGFSDAECLRKYSLNPKGQYIHEQPDKTYSYYWHALVFGDEHTRNTAQKRQLDDYLLFTRNARTLYQSFQEQQDEGKISDTSINGNIRNKASTEFSQIIISLLTKFLPQIDKDSLTRNKRLKQVRDERMFTVVSYSLLGNNPKSDVEKNNLEKNNLEKNNLEKNNLEKNNLEKNNLEKNNLEKNNLEKLLSFATYVDTLSDGYGDCDGWAYDPAFTKDLLDKNRLKRWDANGVFSAYSNYSSAYLAIEPPSDGFASNVIQDVHVPFIYARMQIWFLIIRTSLEHFDRRIFQLTNKLNSDEDRLETHLEKFKQLHAEFIRFTNIYWFREITSETQGIEISNFMRQNQNIANKYDRIKDELQSTAEYLQNAQDLWYQKAAHTVGYISAFLVFIAIYLSTSPFVSLGETCNNIAIAGTLLFTGIGAYLIYKEKHKPIKKRLGFHLSILLSTSLLLYLLYPAIYYVFCLLLFT